MSSQPVFYLGSLQNVSIMAPSPHESPQTAVRPSEVQLVDRIENAQLEGRLPYVGTDSAQVTVHFDLHGLKIIDAKTADVINRTPLHSVAQAVAFSDGWGRWNVAVKTGQTGTKIHSCHVFQVDSEASAQTICRNLEAVFQEASRN